MSEDYKIQLSSTINGNLLNLRAQSSAELADLVGGLEADLDAIITSFTTVKQGIIAKDIFTGNAGGKNGANSAGNSVGSGDANASGPPRCKHGPMKDLRSKNYKSDYYCSSENRDEQCKPVKL